MNYLERFNQGGFSLWWTLRWLQAIFCAWAVVSLLGFFLHSKRFSELGYMLSDTFLYIVLLTAVVQGALWVFRRVRSR
jgi:heme/copper-type cytochrome/quinol oxidase subunit 4